MSLGSIIHNRGTGAEYTDDNGIRRSTAFSGEPYLAMGTTEADEDFPGFWLGVTNNNHYVIVSHVKTHEKVGCDSKAISKVEAHNRIKTLRNIATGLDGWASYWEEGQTSAPIVIPQPTSHDEDSVGDSVTSDQPPAASGQGSPNGGDN